MTGAPSRPPAGWVTVRRRYRRSAGSTWPSGDGLDAAFKMGTGDAAGSASALLVRVRTAPGQFEQYQDEVAALLRSITPGADR